MNYFKIIYRTGEEDWETSEVIIDENQHEKIQSQMSEGSDFIFVKDKATIKRSAIVSISSANDIVATYQKQGLNIDGLLEPPEIPKLIGTIKSTREYVEEKLKEAHNPFFKKMGWK